MNDRREQVIKNYKTYGMLGIGTNDDEKKYIDEHYKPWDLKLTSNKEDIHISWFRNRDRNISGDFFGLIPSLRKWDFEHFTVDGRKVNYDELELIDSHPGTGAGLLIYNKK